MREISVYISCNNLSKLLFFFALLPPLNSLPI